MESFANPDVLTFYRELPFNYRESAGDHAEKIMRMNQLLSYPVLLPLLANGASILDVGCGVGWFGLTAAYYYGCKTTGIDFNDLVIERAREVAEALKVPASFQVTDLFKFAAPIQYDLVTSLGVLHHTNDCRAALDWLCTHYVKPGGHVFVGLYHQYGRRPFLEHFRQMRAAGASETDMFERYKSLHSSLTDETHQLSWFRDQVLHPHETQHTLRELMSVLEARGMRLVSTSINAFAQFGNMQEIFEAEPRLEKVAIERLRQNRYYPGFFVFLARKD
jgi:2-polyprenyl-3-methyl-5-hydroxy-6-metoxy-1,4-benzoquinol methylase